MINKNLLYLVAFAVIVFALHYGFSLVFPTEILEVSTLIKLHSFIFFITTIVIVITNRVTDKMPDKTGFVYLGLVLFKMITSVFFLFPYFSFPLKQSKVIVVNFFIVFLFFIVFEAVSVIKYLNKKNQK